ncbi:cytochrome C biogenesis protein [Patescibacteria group bacterium]|nr:cytochrome C biogenesis protein [Patescibacteria group bacterium]
MRLKTILAILSVSLLALIIIGVVWFFVAGTATPVGIGWYMFSFAAGLTMIVLPCTLPLAFVIVPLSMGKGVVKGLGMAIAFGSGVTIMLSAYGIIAALVGEFTIGALGAPLELVKNWLYFIAGLFAYIFALGELGLLRFRMPTYTGAAPAFIQRRQDYLKAFFLGIFLGNIGVGCPHPATPLILVEIASVGDVLYGWSLFFIHAVGRVLPLFLLAILGVLGVNGLSWLVKRKDKVERATGWGMVFVAGFILVLGLFTHDWWVQSGQHSLFEQVTQENTVTNLFAEKIGQGKAHAHVSQEIEGKTGLLGLPLVLGNWVLVGLWILPLWWYYLKNRRKGAVAQETTG